MFCTMASGLVAEQQAQRIRLRVRLGHARVHLLQPEAGLGRGVAPAHDVKACRLEQRAQLAGADDKAGGGSRAQGTGYRTSPPSPWSRS